MPRVEYKYERIKTPVSDQKTLRDAGFTPFFSSNVSAGQRDGKDLFIRFHNGTVYQYPNKGDRFGELLTSPSKGQWVWRNLRNTNAPFNKVGSFPLQGDRDLTDEELEAEMIRRNVFADIINIVGKTTKTSKRTLGLIDTALISTTISSDALLAGIIASNIASII